MTASRFRRFWHLVLTWSGPVLLLFLALSKICEWTTERLWFESLGYGSYFQRLLLWRVGAFAAGALLFGLWLGVNAQIAWRNATSRAVPLSFFQSDDAARFIPLEDKLHLDRYRRRATVLVLLVLSWLAGLGFSARYLLFVRAFSVQGTGIRDLASNFDLAFFLFSLPFYQWLSRFLLGAIITALLLVTAIYLYEETIGAPADSSSTRKVRAPRVSQSAAKHLAILWSMLLLWKGFDCLLDVPLGFVSGGNVAARVFDPIDIRLGWTSAMIFALSAPLIALLSGLSIAREPRYRTFVSGAIWMICAGTIPFLLPLVAPRTPQDAGWKTALSRHLKSTRRAWELESVERRSLALAPDAPFRAASNFPNSAGDSSTEVSAPLPLWPAAAARNALNARLEARGVAFQVTQVFLERAPNDSLRYVGVALPQIFPSETDWRAQHQRAPRGLWVQMEASRVGPNGAPIFLPDLAIDAFLGAAPTSSAASRPRISNNSQLQTEIALGDNATGNNDQWVFTSTKNEAIEESIASETQNGVRGVSLRNWGTRLLLAARFLEPQLARATSSGDKITWHRAAAARCRVLAPFLDWRGSEARPVVLPNNSGATETSRLVWLVPGLIWSDDYPDSATPAAIGTAPPGVNYGRHVAVGVVDARSGEVALYTLDEDEPFMALTNRAFAGLFAPPTSIPLAIRAALRPSPALLEAQTLIWARYHHENSDQMALNWAAQRDNYRPLLWIEGAAMLRSLASQTSGDWLCMAYARPEGQIGGGSVSLLTSILGADERDFGARGAKVRFVEWKARAPLTLPAILIEPTVSLPTNRPAPPTLLGLAPRFDAQNNAVGLVATRGVAQLQPEKTPGGAREIRLSADVQISGAAPFSPAETQTRPPNTDNSQTTQNFQNARAAWRDLQTARKIGDWENVARAEKRLDDALGATSSRR